ncbi:MAG: carboxypeptidase regulatory-like domain-containing protein, partial [Deltaproteobacteria bacterium]|nr:carboxypeptidase regulatory-like domain-containing protein [Deltaproteobacteria bacterium]
MKRALAAGMIVAGGLAAWVLLRPARAPAPSVVEPSPEVLPAADLASSREESRPGAQQEVKGEVRDGHRLVAGASVFLQSRTIETGHDGRFSLTMVPGLLWARGDGLVSQVVELETGSASEGIVLSLHRPAGLRLIARERGRAGPLSGALVQLFPSPSPPERTGPDGKATLLALPPGEAQLRVSAEGFVPWEQPVDLPVGETLTLLVELERAAAIDGRVVDRSGVGLPGAEVMASGFDQPERIVARARSLADGAFRLDGLAVGALLLRAHAEGYAEGLLSARAPGGPLRITVGLGSEVEGTVRDRSGHPVDGATVVARLQPLGLVSSGRAMTDSEGRYDLRGLAPGRYEVRASVPGSEASAPGLVDLEEEARALLDLEVEVGTGTIRGRVIDAETGVAIGSAKVRAVSEAASPGAQVEAGVDGGFVLEHLAGDRLVVTAQAPGYSAMQVEARPGDGLVLPLTATVRIAGRVLDEDGVPLADFLVDDDAIHAADGRFAVERSSSTVIVALSA